MNKSTLILIGTMVMAICIGVYANYSSEESEVNLYLDNDSLVSNISFYRNICEVENETTWWKDDEGFYFIGNKPIKKGDCFHRGYSIRLSKEYIVAFIEIMKDVEALEGEQDG